MPTKKDFDEFDSLFRDLQADFLEIDGPVKPAPGITRVVHNDPQRPNLPVGSKDFYWDRDIVENMMPCLGRNELTIDGFCGKLGSHAKLFVWNHFEDGQYIRGWDKEGYSYDPVTAVLRVEHRLSFSLCITDLAGSYLGLSPDAARKMAFICWNPEPEILQRVGLSDLRKEVIEAIKEGLK